MLKASLKTLVAQSLRWTGRLRAAEGRARSSLSILCLHRVLPAPARAAYFDPVLAITPEALDTICATLAPRARVLPLAEAVEAWTQGASDRPIVALTFDDGYQDNRIHAAPVLARHGVRASFYVVSDLVGADAPPWYDRLGAAVQRLTASGQPVDADGQPSAQAASPTQVVARAKELAPEARRARVDELEARGGGAPVFPEEDRIMSWEDLRALQEAGHEIGSHSRSHEILPQLDDAQLSIEILDSKQQLEDGLGAPVRSFCFPNGDYDARALALVEQAGYEAALSTLPGNNLAGEPRFTLRRHFVHQDAWSGWNGRVSPTWVRAVVAGCFDRPTEAAGGTR